MISRRITLVLPLLLLASCSFFSKSQSKYYSLDRIPPATAPAASARGTVPVGIDNVELPPGLDRREIVVRKANQQLEIRSAEQWSASFQPLVLHTLAYDLADRMPEGTVILPGASKPATMQPIDVVFEELAAGPSNVVTLDCHWTEGNVAHREHITVDIPSLDSANIASGISRALGMLADRLWSAVAQPPLSNPR